MPLTEPYGDLLPYGDPSWYQGFHSAFFNSSHLAFRHAVRQWVEDEIVPHVEQWDEGYATPREVWKKCYEAGILPGVIGPVWPERYAGSHIAGGVKPEEWNIWHELILIDELSRCGSGGVMWGLAEGLTIGLPAVINHAKPHIADRVAPQCLRGEAIICLAVTEPSGGSDVAGLTTTAKLTDDGKHYIVNGQKKWITNGIWADYFTTAVRTGGPGAKGVSMLLIPRSAGVTTTQMKCEGVWASGTTYVEFHDVKVPAEYLIGEENQGFKYIMYNFNHERWGLAIQSLRFARLCLEQSFAYSMKRKTFGKRLIDHPVIRQKLAHMARMIESSQNWLEVTTHNMHLMSHNEMNQRLGSSIALLKVQVTQTAEYAAREAAQIFGGLAYTRGGQGGVVERLYREVRPYAIGGGSEEILMDFAIRRAAVQKADLQKQK